MLGSFLDGILVVLMPSMLMVAWLAWPSNGSELRFLKIWILDAAFCNSLDCVLYYFDEPKCENNYPNNSET